MNSRSLMASLVAVSAVLVFGQVRAATWYVAENGSDATGDGTVEHPFATISNAFAHASSEVRDTIRLADGTYGATASRLVLDKAVEIAGNDANPRAVTVDGLDKNPFALVNHADVFIHGIRVYRARLSADIRTSVSGAESFSATPFEIVKGVVSNCIMEAGYGLFAGGISVQKNSSAKVYDTVITGTRSGDQGTPAYGGGLRIYGGLAQNCVISNNTCARGAGAYVWGGTVRGCRIVRNVSGCSTGAGLYIKGGTVEDCAVVSNKTGTTGIGGGVYMEGGTIRNSLVAFNTTGTGGGIYIQKGSPVVQNCTVAKNTSSVACDGIYMKVGSVVNTAVGGEEGTSIVSSGGSVTYSCSMSLANDAEGAASPKHNVRAVPGFRDEENGDFTLVGASPCVDAGSELSWHADAKDVSGVTDRVLDGKGTGTPVVDIGAYEYDPSKAPTAVSFSSTFTLTGTFPQAVTLTPCVEGTSGEITAVQWDFGDGTTDTTLPLRKITHDYAKAGYYTIKLTVTVSGIDKPLVCEIKDAVKIKPTTVYVAKGKSATPPYDTLEKATESLEDALSALAIPASGRGRVIVADGTYAALSKHVFLESAIEIAGNDADPSAVTFDGGGTNTFFLLNHVDSFVHGVRVYRTMTPTGVRASTPECADLSATSFEVVRGVISNCVMDSCSGGYASGISVQNNVNAKVYDTVITRITTSTAYGGGLRVYGGWVENCTVTNNTCAYGAGGCVRGGTVRGCRFIGNVSGCSTGAGLYIMGGTVENCVVVSNKTGSTGTGGGVYQEGGTLRGALIVANTSGQGGGLYQKSGTAVNVTIADNESATSAGAKVAGTLVNSIVMGKGEYDSSNPPLVVSGGTVSRSCSPSLTAADCLSDDPRFVSPAKGNYQLRSSSKCVGFGDNAAWPGLETAVDLNGKPRLRSRRIDLGAYECEGGGFMLIVR